MAPRLASDAVPPVKRKWDAEKTPREWEVLLEAAAVLAATAVIVGIIVTLFTAA